MNISGARPGNLYFPQTPQVTLPEAPRFVTASALSLAKLLGKGKFVQRVGGLARG